MTSEISGRTAGNDEQASPKHFSRFLHLHRIPLKVSVQVSRLAFPKKGGCLSKRTSTRRHDNPQNRSRSCLDHGERDAEKFVQMGAELLGLPAAAHEFQANPHRRDRARFVQMRGLTPFTFPLAGRGNRLGTLREHRSAARRVPFGPPPMP